jgi:hypothetical protein
MSDNTSIAATPVASNFIRDIIQDDLPTHTEPPRDKFLAWHRVKKEYIRRFQWNEITARMIKRYWRQQLQQDEGEWSLDETSSAGDKLDLPANVALDRPLRCLVIPGEDLLVLAVPVDGQPVPPEDRAGLAGQHALVRLVRSPGAVPDVGLLAVAVGDLVEAEV